MRTEDVVTQDPICFFVSQDFVVLCDVGVGQKRKCAFVVLDRFGSQLIFRLADRCDLGLRVDDAGNGIIVDVAMQAVDLFDTGNGSFVRQSWFLLQC